MKRKIAIVVRYLLGLVFFVFGLNGFFHFIPMPPMSPEGGAMLGALANTGYFFPLLKTVETASGFLLLINRFVPLALTLLAPVIVNILAFHVFLDHGGLPMAIVLTGIESYLGYMYCPSFGTMLKARAEPCSECVDAPQKTG